MELHQEEPRVIQLSLRWVLCILLLIIAIGMAGGFIGSSLASKPLAPLTGPEERLITTMQEVTISPNKFASQLVETYGRSLYTIADTSGNEARVIGTGIAVTNDGLIVTTREAAGSNVKAFANNGQAVGIEEAGTDALYGLYYYRLTEGIATPVELATENPGAGSQALMMSHSTDTFQPQAFTWQLAEYSLPAASDPAGWQQIAHYTAPAFPALPGSLLVNDDGKLVGIVTDTESTTALPVSAVRASLDRVSRQELARNPYSALGFRLTHRFAFNADRTRVTYAPRVIEVTANSLAAQAGLRQNDVLTAINSTTLSWKASIADQLAASLPIELTVNREGAIETLTIRQATPSPTPTP